MRREVIHFGWTLVGMAILIAAWLAGYVSGDAALVAGVAWLVGRDIHNELRHG